MSVQGLQHNTQSRVWSWWGGQDVSTDRLHMVSQPSQGLASHISPVTTRGTYTVRNGRSVEPDNHTADNVSQFALRPDGLFV